MAEGKVISGGQNDFKPFGEIVVTDASYAIPVNQKSSGETYQRNTITYKKGRVNKNTNRNHNECWTGGTPVTWKDNVQRAKTSTKKIPGSIDDMLVSRDPVTKKITEYHPVITFFNEVMAQIMRDGLRDVISNLEKEDNAIKMWAYLENKYLNGNGKKAGKKETIKSSARKMTASKMMKPLKKNKLSKKGNLVKKK